MAKDIFGLKISVVVLIFIIVIGSIFLLATSTIGTENKLLGLAIIWVALLPSLIFLQDGDQPPIPFFPLVGIFYALFFGFPVFLTSFIPTRNGVLILYNKVTISFIDANSLAIILAALVLMLAAFYGAKLLVFRQLVCLKIKGTENPTAVNMLFWLLAIIHFFYEFIPLLKTIPSFGQFAGPVIYVAIGGLFLQWNSGKLSNTQALIFAFIVIPLEIQIRGSGFLITPMLLLFLFMILVLWWVKKHKIIIGLIVASLCLISIYDLTSALRNPRDQNINMTKAIFQFYIQGKDKLDFENGRQIIIYYDRLVPLIHRISQVWVFQMVVQSTPDKTPYWQGETYKPLLTSFIPRAFYPGKPKEQTGYKFGQKYGFLDQNNELTTSVNMPWITEFYANFGLWGVLIGMPLIGLFLAFLDKIFNADGMNNVEFVVGTTLIFPLIYPESNLSLMTGSMLPLFVSLFLYFRFGPAIIERLFKLR